MFVLTFKEVCGVVRFEMHGFTFNGIIIFNYVVIEPSMQQLQCIRDTLIKLRECDVIILSRDFLWVSDFEALKMRLTFYVNAANMFYFKTIDLGFSAEAATRGVV